MAPENTLEAFERAVRTWEADILEMDVRRTRDGELVVIHDPTVDRVSDGTGPVAELTWARIRELDAGYRFRDLEGVCRCPKDLPACVCGRKPRIRLLTRKPLRPSGGEVEQNPMSRSALLRAAEKLPAE